MTTGDSQRRMRAAWYEHKGAAGEVLQVGELAIPEPGPGEVRVRVAVSAINPSDRIAICQCTQSG
jgi:NADPH:quinone reductase-like Zn-dependent oxidoreductase